MKYYFTEYNKMQYYNASNKAREDVNKILQKKGYKFLPFYDNSNCADQDHCNTIEWQS